MLKFAVLLLMLWPWRAAAIQVAGAHVSGNVRVVFLANEGVMIRSPQGAVLIDALFGDGLPSYANVPQPSRDSLERALPPYDGDVLVLATHAHRDHFNAEALARYLRSNPRGRAFLLEDQYRQLAALGTVDTGRVRLLPDPNSAAGPSEVQLPWVRVRTLAMPHGPTSNVVLHTGFLVDIAGTTLLHGGDTQLFPPDWNRLELPAGGIDLAMLGYWLITQDEWIASLRDDSRVRQILMFHAPLPAAESQALRSRGGWRAIANGMRQRYPFVFVPEAYGDAITLPGGERR